MTGPLEVTKEDAELAELRRVSDAAKERRQRDLSAQGDDPVTLGAALSPGMPGGARRVARRNWCDYQPAGAGKACGAPIEVGRNFCDACGVLWHRELLDRKILAAAAALPSAFDHTLATPEGRASLAKFLSKDIVTRALSMLHVERVLLLGPAGQGKTTLAVAMLRAMAARALDPASNASDQERHRAAGMRFCVSFKVAEAKRHHGRPGERVWEQLCTAPILLLDDVGREREALGGAVPELITERHAQKGLTTIVTSAKVLVPAERSAGDDDETELHRCYDGGTVSRLFNAAVIRLGLS